MPSILPTHLQNQCNFGEVENKQQPLCTHCKKHNTKQLRVYFISEVSLLLKFEQRNKKYNLKKKDTYRCTRDDI